MRPPNPPPIPKRRRLHLDAQEMDCHQFYKDRGRLVRLQLEIGQRNFPEISVYNFRRLLLPLQHHLQYLLPVGDVPSRNPARHRIPAFFLLDLQGKYPVYYSLVLYSIVTNISTFW